jgi:6-pyruvoyltetrahydropterin/6-carboxytetrahydropterin synthase
MQVRLVHEFRFEAAHRLPRVPAGHKCARLHGHSFRVELAIEGPVNPETGWFMDFGDLYRIWEPIHETLDHHYLNEVPGLEKPTSEVDSRYIWLKLRPKLPALRRVTLFETCESRCEYEGIDD